MKAVELGRRRRWEAQADGLDRPRRVRSVNEGASWIWNLVADRWSQAGQVLDFYCGSQHLHGLGAALHGEGTAATSAWVVPGRKRLRRGNAAKLLQELKALEPPGRGSGRCGEAKTKLLRATRGADELPGTFAQRPHRQRGGGIGVPAAAMPIQAGQRHLCALQKARRNGHWEELWNTPNQP